MFYFVMDNIQSIDHCEIRIEENTLVEFIGDNSNGKSALSKVLQTLTSGGIYDYEEREALIKDGRENASVLIQYNKKQLGLVLYKEAKKSFVIYVPDCDSKDKNVVRYLNEGGIDEIIAEFGFRVYDKGNICLQISPTFGSIPFVTTSGTTNNDIIMDMTSDKVADGFIEVFEKITYPAFKNRLKILKDRKEQKEKTLASMKFYNWQAYEDIATVAKKIYGAIYKYEYHNISNISIPPNVLVNPADCHLLNNIKIPKEVKIYEKSDLINKLDKELHDYVTMLNGICPTCGKPLIE